VPKRFVILDRDGTLIVERNYLTQPGEVELLPGVAAGLRRLGELGLGLVVVSNQSAIGRGMLDREGLDAVHGRMNELLAQVGAPPIDAIYICPHTPEDLCGCRKPRPGLVVDAARELNFDPRRAFVIGDKECDIDLGSRVGATSILVRTGYGCKHLRAGLAKPHLVVDDLDQAARLIERILEGSMQNDGVPGLYAGATELVRAHILGSISTKQRLLDECSADILAAAARITASLGSGGKLLLCGNGGSAADCQHIAAELVSVLTQDFLRPGLPAIALTTDSSILTASANDFGFDGIFERQVQALGRPGDVVIGISTSGNSANVLRALRYAAGNGMSTIALIGASGGKMGALAEIAIRVPSASVQHIQESHIAIGHILCALAERTLFANHDAGKEPAAAANSERVS
jgi:D-sedoheptulose 7-phosphate isomerase